MSPTLAARRAPRRPDSWAGQWLTRLFFHEAEVQANEALAPGLHRITLVLVGRAATVQHLLRDLKAHGVPASRIRTKAYWADGKTGMD